MPCENYREALIEAAAADTALSYELRSHLDACASCRAAFTGEQQLFAAIDTGLRARANAEMPESLLPRVRAQLSERPVLRRAWIPAFGGIGIAAALVVVFSLARNSPRVGVEPNQGAISAARSAPLATNQPAPAAILPLEIAQTVPQHGRVGTANSAPIVVAAGVEAEVLIPAGQKQAINALLAGFRQGDIRADALPAETPEKPFEELEVSPLDISPIEIKPLPDLGGESATPDENTRR